jgi:endonuclease/exonuclease/phosphatase family metal-dependent hydrolase
VLRVGGAPFAVAGTHLDLVAEPRLRHVGELQAALAAHVPPEVPVIVCGDFNCRPGSPPWAALTELLQDAFAVAGVGSAFTSTAKNPHQTIDGIFVDPRISVLSARVLDHPDVEVASDHRPLLAELELGAQ